MVLNPINEKLPLMEHLTELRRRIIIIIAAITAASTFFYFKVPVLFDLLTAPIAALQVKLIFTSLTAAFIMRVKMAVVFGAILSGPIIAFQIVSFINPGLTGQEKKLLYRCSFFLVLFFSTGVVLGCLMLMPGLLRFLVKYGLSYMTPMLQGDACFSFVLDFALVTGFFFDLPYLMFLLVNLNLLSIKVFKKARKYVYLISFSLITVLSPTGDPFLILFFAAPVIIIFETTFAILFWLTKKQLKKGSLPN